MARSSNLPTSVAHMRHGDHYCNIYSTDDEHRAIIVDFVRQGSERRERMLYIVNVHTAAQLRGTLADAGIRVDELVESGQLVIQTAKQAYLKDGEFDPDKMVELLDVEVKRALEDGYTGLRITGDMTWALAGDPGSERLIEYEAKLNDWFPGTHSYAICQYDRRRFDSELLLDILHTHPKVLLGTKGHDNTTMYYVPPEAFLDTDRQSAVLDRWMHNLGEREPAE